MIARSLAHAHATARSVATQNHSVQALPLVVPSLVVDGRCCQVLLLVVVAHRSDESAGPAIPAL